METVDGLPWFLLLDVSITHHTHHNMLHVPLTSRYLTPGHCLWEKTSLITLILRNSSIWSVCLSVLLRRRRVCVCTCRSGFQNTFMCLWIKRLSPAADWEQGKELTIVALFSICGQWQLRPVTQQPKYKNIQNIIVYLRNYPVDLKLLLLHYQQKKKQKTN